MIQSKYQKILYSELLSRILIGIAGFILLGSGPAFAQYAEILPLRFIQPGETMTVESKSGEELDLRFSIPPKTAHIDIPINKFLKDKKLNFTFSKLENVSVVRIRPFFKDGVVQENRSISIPLGKDGGIKLDYFIILAEGYYEFIRLELVGGRLLGSERSSTKARVVVSNISLMPVGITDSLVFIYVMTIIISVYILLPGILMFPLVHRQEKNKGIFKCFFASYSVIFYTVGYLVWITCTKFQLFDADLTLLLYVFLGIIILVYLNINKDRGENLIHWLQWDGIALVIYCMLILSVTCLVVRGTNLPIENTWYTTIAGPKTYGAFRAHDAVFHYVNGFAISNNEPFDTYYSGRRLVYNVEDREILPGVIYAGLRSALQIFSHRIADSFLIYTIFGICMNLLIIFPVLAFIEEFIGTKNRSVFVLTFSLNSFVLVNYFLTWFKMAGGAFYLCGLYILLHAKKVREWSAAGMLFGIGANMHSGSALGIPLFFVWAVYNRFLQASSPRIKLLIAPSALIIVFVLLNLPWATIKHHYLRDSNALIREHFLNGVSGSGGLIKTTKRFFSEVPMSEQILRRTERLVDSLRIKEVKILINKLKTEGFSKFKLLWNQFEFRFVAFSFYPLLGLLVLSAFFELFNHKVLGKNRTAITVKSPRMVIQLIGFSAFTIAFIIFLSYGSHKPDLNYHLPLGVTILSYSLVLGCILQSKGIYYLIPLVYFSFSAFRIFSDL